MHGRPGMRELGKWAVDANENGISFRGRENALKPTGD